jgi:hypothetical protein
MAARLVQSESGDWFLIPWEIEPSKFREDEYEMKASYAKYVANPEDIYIIEDFSDV